MLDTELIQLWKAYDKKLETSIALNRKNTEAITKIKVGSLLNSLRPLKIFTILIGILWVLFLDILVINLFSYGSTLFLISAGMVSLLNKIAIGLYVYQIVLIHQADIDEPVLATQAKLARLKSSTLWIARILILQLPFWTTFYWSKSMIEQGPIMLWILQIFITLSFSLIAIWFFVNIKFENKEKKWFKFIFNDQEWNNVMRSVELLHDIDDYKNG